MEIADIRGVVIQIVRWVFVLSILMIPVLLIRISRKLDRDFALSELILQYLTQAQTPKKPEPPPRSDPPTAMGSDFAGGLFLIVDVLRSKWRNHVNARV